MQLSQAKQSKRKIIFSYPLKSVVGQVRKYRICYEKSCNLQIFSEIPLGTYVFGKHSISEGEF